MISNIRPLLVTLAFVALSGAGGAYLGAQLIPARSYSHEDFHDRLLFELQLSDEQQQQMNALEVRHVAENRELQAALSAANRGLAESLARHDEYGAGIEQAIEDVHVDMLELQKTTIRHLYEMRDILTPEQQVIFDRHVQETIREFAR